MKINMLAVTLKVGETALVRVVHHGGNLFIVVDDQHINCSENQARIAEEIRNLAESEGKPVPAIYKPGTTNILLKSREERSIQS